MLKVPTQSFSSPHVRESGIQQIFASTMVWNPLRFGIRNPYRNLDLSYASLLFHSVLPVITKSVKSATKQSTLWLVFVLLLIIQRKQQPHIVKRQASSVKRQAWERAKRMRDAWETIVFTVSTQMPACMIHSQDKINTSKICIWTLQSPPVSSENSQLPLNGP